jgi:small nuclear ribonucleoprotein (snRNP)-like protein
MELSEFSKYAAKEVTVVLKDKTTYTGFVTSFKEENFIILQFRLLIDYSFKTILCSEIKNIELHSSKDFL